MTIQHRRRLSHVYAIGQPMFITWRLYGSLPANRSFPNANTCGEAFVAMDRLLDNARSGPLYLRIPDIAEIVVEAIRHREQVGEYDLHAFVVMPNHVHLLVTPVIRVSAIMQSLKRHTAREANRILCLTGRPLWQAESYDHLVRNPTEFARIVSYIEKNPVTAGIASTPGDFPWSTARPIANRPQVANLPHNQSA